MNLHPAVVAKVKRLIEEGRAGEKPFGIPFAVWQEEIEKEA